MALADYVGAAEELRRRGLPVPVPYSVRQHADVPVDGMPVLAGVGGLGDSIGPETPRDVLPVGMLNWMASDGDKSAQEELHHRYPFLYDEQGRALDPDNKY